MKKPYLTIISIAILTFFFVRYGVSCQNPNTTTTNKVKKLVEEKQKSTPESRLKPSLIKIGFDELPKTILLIALKEERILELWGKLDTEWVLIKKYPFTAFSGKLGPKLKQGDKQIPEGIYNIEYLNPNSSYHLSLKVDYPNEFDRLKAVEENRKKLGGDIFIHGKAVTIGCIPLGDEGIEELFVAASKAINKGIKVIISPIDFRKRNEMPEIESVDWEKELYGAIKKELSQFRN